MALTAAHLNAEFILVVTASVAIGIQSLPPPPPPPPPPTALHTRSPFRLPVPNKLYGFCGSHVYLLIVVSSTSCPWGVSYRVVVRVTLQASVSDTILAPSDGWSAGK